MLGSLCRQEREIRNPSSEYSVATAPQHCALGHAHRRAQFVILNVEQSHVYNVCFAESQRIVPARVSRRAAASCADVDDAAGGAKFAGAGAFAGSSAEIATVRSGNRNGVFDGSNPADRSNGWAGGASVRICGGAVDAGLLHGGRQNEGRLREGERVFVYGTGDISRIAEQDRAGDSWLFEGADCGRRGCSAVV